MTPITTLSKRKRYVYLILCTIAFIVITPLVILYSTGYRFDETFAVLKTGGIYIITQSKDFNVYVNDELQDVSSLFRRNFLIQDIRQGTYAVRVSKEGFTSWEKQVAVFPEKVNEVTPFNLPTNITLVPIEKTLTPQNTESAVSTTTKLKKVPNETYTYAVDLFTPLPETKKVASETEDSDLTTHRRVTLKAEGSTIHVAWIGPEDSAPNVFCNIEYCSTSLAINMDSPIKRAEFFFDRQDLVIFSTEKGIFVVELDGRGGRNIETLALGAYDFRTANNGTLYLKKGLDTYYQVNLAL